MENEFVFSAVSRPIITGGEFGTTISKIKIEEGKIHLHRFKRHLLFFKRKKEDFAGNVADISNIEYTRTINKVIVGLIAIGILAAAFTNGITGTFILAVFFGLYNRNVSINFKDGSKMMLNDIATDYFVPQMVDLLKQTNPNITYDIKK